MYKCWHCNLNELFSSDWWVLFQMLPSSSKHKNRKFPQPCNILWKKIILPVNSSKPVTIYRLLITPLENKKLWNNILLERIQVLKCCHCKHVGVCKRNKCGQSVNKDGAVHFVKVLLQFDASVSNNLFLIEKYFLCHGMPVWRSPSTYKGMRKKTNKYNNCSKKKEKIKYKASTQSNFLTSNWPLYSQDSILTTFFHLKVFKLRKTISSCSFWFAPTAKDPKVLKKKILGYHAIYQYAPDSLPWL